MKTIFCIMGASGSGKSTIVKTVSKALEIPTIITTTSRPPRENEVDGIDYHFKSEDYFKDESKFCEIITYDTVFGKWYYGVEKESIEAVDKAGIIIVTPQGYSQLKAAMPNVNFVPIYIHVPEIVRIERLVDRGDSMNEVKRRAIADEKDFKNVLDLMPVVLYNRDLDVCSGNLFMEINSHLTYIDLIGE